MTDKTRERLQMDRGRITNQQQPTMQSTPPPSSSASSADNEHANPLNRRILLLARTEINGISVKLASYSPPPFVRRYSINAYPGLPFHPCLMAESELHHEICSKCKTGSYVVDQRSFRAMVNRHLRTRWWRGSSRLWRADGTRSFSSVLSPKSVSRNPPSHCTHELHPCFGIKARYPNMSFASFTNCVGPAAEVNLPQLSVRSWLLCS